MCGICGVVGERVSREKRERSVTEMNSAIFHRGPDEGGVFSDEKCSLAMRRLSIIDLAHGQQPLYSNDGKKLIFYNGEIYNYRELRKQLEQWGFTFGTDSDTEVIINLFQYKGISHLLSSLRGMFAFCIYDIEKSEYYFARDRFGEKPFFYYHANGSFVFSSEVRSLLECDFVPRILDKEFLEVYLQKGFVPEPYTLLKDVRTIKPGHYIAYKNGELSEYPYFAIDYQSDPKIKSLDDAACYIEPYLNQAVKRQLVSDVPLGAFLSGGIDSSTIVGLMQKISNKRVQTFNVKFQTKGYDESVIARKVAERLGTDHNEIVVENNAFDASQFWKIIEHVGLPFADSSAIPTEVVTREIRKHVKVALSGDGGDELFGGYNVYDWYRSIIGLKKIPNVINDLIRNTSTLLNARVFHSNKLRQAEKALLISKSDNVKILDQMHALFDEEEINSLLHAASSSYVADIPTKFFEWSELRKAMFYRIKYDLSNDMLVKVDRMSMSNSLEVRSPFLDPDLFEASTKLPDHFLRKGGKGKLILRHIMRDSLPAEVFNHPKSGFSIPLHDFRNDEFKNLAAELLLNQAYMNELFDKNTLERIVLRGIEGTADSESGSVYRVTHQLWSLMMLSGWIRLFNIKV